MFNRQHMEEKITFSLWTRVLIFLVLLVPLVQGYGQTKVFATSQTNGLREAGQLLVGMSEYQDKSTSTIAKVDNVSRLVDGNDTTYATLTSKSATLLGIGATGEAWVTMKFPANLTQNTTSFIKIDKPINTGLSVNLIDLIGGLTGLFEKNMIIVEASLNGSKIESSKVKTSLVENKDGTLYVAISSQEIYNSVTIRLRSATAALGIQLGAGLEMNVYGAFHYVGDTSCGKPLVTGVEAVGLNVNLLGGLFTTVGTNQYGKSIDDDADTYAILKIGNILNVNVGSYFSQYFYFPNKSKTDATFTIKLGANTGLLDLALISGLEIRAYEGNKEVYVRALRGGLLNGVEVLGLLGGSSPATLTFAPGRSFDKVEIRLNTAVNVGLASGGLRIYDVQRYDGTTCINPNFTIPTPTQVPFETASCVTSLVDFQNVDFATNVLDNNNETYATLYAKAGTLLAGEYSSGMIHMAYPNTVPAYTTSYIRIDMEDEIIHKLLGGTLGNLLGGVVGTLIGNHYFEVDAYNGSNSVSHTTSQNGFANTTGGKMTVVQDKIGRFYLAVTPNQPYTSIKITNSVSGLANGAVRALKVYNMCREIGTNPCFAPQFTSYDQTGLSLSLGSLNGAGVTNPYYAISGNSSDYAEISTGTVAVAAKVRQAIYFGKPSQVGDQIKMRLQLNPTGLLALDLAGKYSVVTFLGDQQKEVFTLQQGLINNLNLLNLFKSGGIQTLTFDTTQTFDRVEIQVGSLVNASVIPAIRLYDVKRVSTTCPESSGASPFTTPVCATELLDASNVNDINNLFDGNFDSYATLQSGAGFLLGLGNKYEGYVEMGYATSVPANTTSYVRIDFENTALEKLISGSLGNLVTGILNGLVFGNHDFEVQVKNEQGNVILNRGTQTTNASSSEGTIRVVVDKLGRTYLAITPTSAYKSVRIIDKTNSALGLLAQPNSMNVYGMCYETAPATCVAPFATSYEYEGVNLSVNALGGAGVTYPERAIDDNSTHGSQMSLGTISVAGGVKQWIYFNSLSEADDITNIRLKVGAGGVSVDLLANLEIASYRGDALVDRLDWNNELLEGVDLLGLLNSANVVDIPFKPNGIYDRIAISIKSVVGVGVFPPVEIYKVERLCSPYGPDQNLVSWKSYKVNDDAATDFVTGGETIEYTIHVKNVGSTVVNQFSVSDRIPTGTSFGTDFSNGTLSVNRDLITYNFSGTMTPGNEQRFVFTVAVNPTLEGILQIKNTAFTKEAGDIISYPSYPPVDNTNPTEPDLTKNPGTIIQVVHSTALPKAIITSDHGNAVCSDTEFTLDSNKGPAEADTYQWYFGDEAIDATMAGSTNPNYGKEKTLTTNYPGSYTVVYTKGAEVSVESDPFVVTQSPTPVIQFSSSQRINVTIPRDQNTVTVTLPTATVEGGNGTIKWYNDQAVEFDGSSITFDAPGVYILTVVAQGTNQCESVENVMITVYDDSLCPPMIERVYATGSSSWGSIITGGVSGTSNTIDGDPTTYSTLTTGIGLLGIGTVWQNIYFEEEATAGTPVTIKLGKQYSGLMLAGGISVVGLDADGNTIGTLKSVQGGLLDLLAADNVIEYTFVPSDKNGPKKYKGVRVSQGSLLSVAQIAKVYHAYHTKNVSAFSPEYCEPVSDNVHPAVLDVLHGVQDLGLGVASATASVANPWNAVDGNLETYATIARGVAVLNAASLTVVFKQQAMPGDKLHIVTEVPGNPILSLELIKGYTIQRYLGDQKVGAEIDGTNGAQILDLKLLGLGYRNKYKMIIKDIDQPFDRVKISYGSVVGVLGDLTRIYEVTVAPRIDVGIDIDEEYLDLCQGGILTINAEDNCSTYEVYTEETGGTPVPTEGLNNFRLPYYLPEYQDELPGDTGLGPKYSVVYVQTYRNGCVIGRRLPIRLLLKNCSVKSNLNVTQKIK
ncbi:putative repeat protein (TIGR01451 family) [Myroides gitamensis]|uniref:DUF11 domain-containing protein n=1 Tax=Myroides odoratus TaxID=256 RepID=UPI002167235F|nr:DUF11 domain-containing protein [Myroides odoratus]MCS4237191.1 putative repeat protein (TIGR01451 family) [Myroides odoratus]MDH6602084.1 putative repeat protein (TIGR01451 family) [Myroides gitamensis]